MFPTLFGAFSPKRSDVAPGQDRSAKPLKAGQESADPAIRDALRAEAIELVLEDGLLMALGPDGDPVPPEAFAAMASESPGATVPLASGGEVLVEKAAAVLQAQAGGKIAAGEKADGWIAAMLGLGPRPAMVSPGELAAEADPEASPPAAGPRPVPSGDGGPKAAEDGMPSIPLSVAPPCPEGLNAAQVTLVVLSGLPQDCALSTGIEEGSGRWLLTPADLEGLLLRVPPDCPESMTIKVTTFAITGPNGDLATAHDELSVTCGSAPSASSAEQPADVGPRSRPIEIDPGLIAGPAIDVLVLRGVPAGYVLSAGVHDATIDGWVLRPAEIAELRVQAADGAAARFTITILGIGLGRDAPRQAQEIARVPIVLD